MADAIIYHVSEKVSDLLIQEIDFISDVKEDVKRLQAELKRMQCFLKDADRKQGQDERVRNWIAEIRELAYDADDIIDTFLLKIASGKVGAFSFIHKYTTKFLHLHKIGDKIKSIHVKLADISNSLHTYGIKFVDGEGSSSASETRRRLRSTDPDEDEDVISLESTTKDLMAQLMKTKDHLRVVSIVGMGGLGKSTLAKKVYNSIDVKHHFDCYAWTFISQEFCLQDVVSGILLQVGAPSQMVEEKSVDYLVRTLKNMLNGKRYLVVLDDIWKEETWDSLKCAFPKRKKGSKVLLTTRIREVALYADPRSSPVELPLLTYEEGWKLLSKKSFLENSEDKQSQLPEFEKLGMEMVKKCGGLPLAIVVLGGLLANKSLKEWEGVQRDINSQFSKLQQRSQYAGVEWILALSYDDLPFRLKPCFLYLSQFPEDYEIYKKRLIRMWIAEGFIPKPLKGEGEETIEDVGVQMLEELVNRSMIEVSQRDHTGTGVKTSRMHDLMRDVFVKSKRREFHGNRSESREQFYSFAFNSQNCSSF